MKVETVNRGGKMVAIVHAQTLETENVAAFRSEIAPVLDESSHVVLDLSEVTFMDSTALGAMLSCLRSIKSRQGSLSLAALRPEVRRLFDMVMMDRVFDIFPSVEAAL